MSDIIRFATPEMMIDRMPMSKSIDHEMIKATMYTEQDTSIQNLLGTALYENICKEIDTDTLTGKRLELIKKHIRPALFHHTFKSLAIHLHLRMSDKGILLQGNENSSQAEEKASYKLQSYHANKAEFYQGLAKDFICDNSTAFLDFGKKGEDGGVSPQKKSYFSGIELG